MTKKNETGKKLNYGMIMAVYLLGIFMGALDTGIVTPARTIIQNNLHASDQLGIWMITIYTLAYAASIPVMGKLADKYGRKTIYLVSIVLFGAGSLLCGLSENFGSFAFLLAARSIQAIGGGGIVPVATAEFGTIFPENKRGLALGLVGGVYGIANIFGSSAGSAILDIFGKSNWQYIFYINVPISIFIIAAGLAFLPNTRLGSIKKIDFSGIFLLVVMVLSLIYGLKNIDFFNFTQSVASAEVYPFLIAFAVLLPVFILAERKAEDPVMNLSYFGNFRIILILLFSIVSGIILMGMIFIPQFAENELRIATGSGGYFTIILGVFAGVGAPFSGKMIDKYGAKPVLGLGFLLSMAGALFLILAAIPHPSFFTVFLSLTLIGLGVGFTIGTPLNYMMLANTKKEESSSALATLSLVRSIGTTVAPAIMIGFLAHAGGAVQSNIMDLLPQQLTVPQLPYAQELNDKLTEYKNDPNMKQKMAGIDFPDLASMTTVDIDMNSGSADIPDALVEKLKNSDITTITSTAKLFAGEMFKMNTPAVVAKITDGVQKGIDSLTASKADLEKKLAEMQAAAKYATMANTNGMPATVKGSSAAGAAGMPASVKGGSAAGTAGMPASVKSSSTAGAAGMPASVKGNPMADAAGIQAAIKGIQSAIDEMNTTLKQMQTLKAAVPGAFDQALNNYLAEIDTRSAKIESVYQTTLNHGFHDIYLFILIATASAFLFLLFYPENRKEEDQEKDPEPTNPIEPVAD